jgi:hypothetical protein
VVARNVRGAGRCAVARLLLFVLDEVSKLDRKLLLLLVALPMAACIIPAGPEFQDPAGVPNSPPFLLFAASPPEGMTVVDTTPTFSVTASDLNVNDHIWIKWITEYPPYSGSTKAPEPTHISPSDDGSQLHMPDVFRPTCIQLNIALSTHKVMAAISDREFVHSDDPADLLTTMSDVPPIQVVWTWQKSCPGGSQ